MGITCPHCSTEHGPDVLFCPKTGKAISVSRLTPGSVIDDKYEVVRRLASGGMGAVYEVIHRRIGRRLAMKLILPELATNEEVIRRFEREARAASAIGHQNIVEITDMGSTREGLPFIVMEYLDGMDLAALLADEKPQPLPRTMHIMSQILEALGAAHSHQIIHRDLKPENIFLIRRSDDSDFVKLLDFGISKIAGGEEAKLQLTSTGLILGTPYYMSPEQARGEKELDHRSDLFAAGTIAYQMLTGKRPFDADNLHKLLYQIVRGEITPPQALNPEVPEPLQRVVLKALALDPDQRFSDAESFRAALVGERLVATHEIPRFRIPPAGDKTDAAHAPTIAESSAVNLAMDATGTPMAWTGEQPPARRRGKRALLLGAGGVLALGAAILAWQLLGAPPSGETSGAAGRGPADSGAASGDALRGSASADAGTARPVAPPTDRFHPGPTVQIRLRLSPPDARVILDGRERKARPLVIPRDDRTHELRVEANGHIPQSLTVHARRDQLLVVQLLPRSARRPPPMRVQRPTRRTPRPSRPRGGMRKIRAFDGSDI